MTNFYFKVYFFSHYLITVLVETKKYLNDLKPKTKLLILATIDGIICKV